MRKVRSLLLCAALVPGTVGLAACGGGDDGGGEDPKQVIRKAFSGKKDVRSADIDVSFVLNAKGVKELNDKPVTLKLTGPFESEGKAKLPKFDFNVNVDAAGQKFDAGAVSTGDKGFIKFRGTSYVADDSTFQQFKSAFEAAQKQNQGEDGPKLSQLGIDPVKWLKDPKNEGEEEVGGAETTHVSSGVDVAAMLKDLSDLFGKAGSLGLGGLGGQNVPNEIPAEARRQLEQAVKDVKFDVWVGNEDDIMRKLELALTFEVPEEARSQAGGLEGGDLKLSIALNGLNQSQEINAPEGAKPLQELFGQLGAFGGLLGQGLGGGGAGSGGSGGGSGGGSSSDSSGDVGAYSDCIQKAAGPEELQKCSALLE